MDNLVGRYNCRYFCVAAQAHKKGSNPPKATIVTLTLFILLPILYKASIQHQVSIPLDD